MSLVRLKVFSVAVFVAISTMTLSLVKAQDAQPMSEITLGSGTATGGGGANGLSVVGSDGVVAVDDGGTGTISSPSTTGPEAVAFDGTYIWVAMQFTDSVTRVRVRDGVVSGTFAVGKRPVALLYAGSAI